MRAETLARAERALGDPGRARIVARARIKLPRHEDEAPTVRTLEDALRTAEFDDCGRLVIVRTLVLPRFPVRASSAWVARAIEAAWRTQAAYAVHASTAEASSARAVFFRDLSEARVELMQTLIDSGNADAWFWPLAIPEFAPGVPRSEAMVRMLAGMIRDTGTGERPGLTTLGIRMQRWSPAQLRAFVDALPPELPAACAAYASSVSSTPSGRTVPQVPVPAPAAAVEAVPIELDKEQDAVVSHVALVLAGPPPIRVDDWRMVVLAQALIRARAPSGLAPARRIVRNLLRAAASDRANARVDDTSHREAGSTPPAAQREAVSQPPDQFIPVADLQDATLAPGQRNPEEAHGITGAFQPLATATSSVRVPRLPWLDAATATRFGGLLLALNVLDRLGIGAWLALQTPGARNSFVMLLLYKVAQRLQMPNDDPHRELFAGAPDVREALRDSIWLWSGFGWPAWSRLEPLPDESADLESSVSQWIRALRNVLRRRCGIGLASLARRDAWLSVTATHVDIVFTLDATDMRVRRAGLDGDPGWVPWFGRIVALHFVDHTNGDAPDA